MSFNKSKKVIFVSSFIIPSFSNTPQVDRLQDPSGLLSFAYIRKKRRMRRSRARTRTYARVRVFIRDERIKQLAWATSQSVLAR